MSISVLEKPHNSRAFFVVNLLMLQLRIFFVANVAFTRFFCRECRDYVLFGVEFWQKFLEILRILAEILRKKLAAGASGLMYIVIKIREVQNMSIYLEYIILSLMGTEYPGIE